MSKRKSLRIAGLIVQLALAAVWVSFCHCGTATASYSFSLDRFEVSGNVPGYEVDEFDDGVVSPWVIFDPTVVESGGVVNFSTPGTVESDVFDSYYIVSEMSFIGSGYPSEFNVENGSGDFTGVSRWSPIIPGVNQWYEMQVGYELQQEPYQGIDISLAVANWDTDAADFLGIPSGLGITFYRSGDIPLAEWVWQHIPIAESDITGDVLLRLDFEDDTDQFTPYFSLDGGETYQNPFAPIGWGLETPGRYEWYFSGQAILVLQPIDTLSGLVWMESGSDFGYSLEESNFVYFLSFGPVWYYNSTTGLWDLEGPAGLVYVGWPFMYEIATGSLWFVLPPVSGLWVYHFSTGEWGLLPRIIPF